MSFDVLAAGCQFRIDAPQSLAGELQRWLQPTLVAGDASGFSELIEVRAGGPGHEIFVDGTRFIGAATVPDVVRGVVAAVGRRVLDHNDHHSHLHAGVVAIDGCAVLLHGARQAGKSTAVAALSRSVGAVVGTDEMVAIDDDGSVTCWPKPVLLRGGGAEALGVDQAVGNDRTVPFAPWEHGAITATRFDIALTLALRYEAGAPTQLRSLTPCDALLGLVDDTLDLGRSEPVGLTRFGRMVARADTYELHHGMRPEALAGFVRELAASVERPDRDLEVLPSVAAADGVGHAPRTEAVRIDDAMVAHNYATDAVLSLDAAGVGLWRMIDGHRDADDLPGGPEFIAQLVEHGLVEWPG